MTPCTILQPKWYWWEVSWKKFRIDYILLGCIFFFNHTQKNFGLKQFISIRMMYSTVTPHSTIGILIKLAMPHSNPRLDWLGPAESNQTKISQNLGMGFRENWKCHEGKKHTLGDTEQHWTLWAGQTVYNQQQKQKQHQQAWTVLGKKLQITAKHQRNHNSYHYQNKIQTDSPRTNKKL